MTSVSDRTTGPTPWKPGDRVWVHAYQKWRHGVVTTAVPAGAWVDFQSRAVGGQRNSRFSDAEGTILSGALPAPILTSCPSCRRKIVDGRPGEDEDQVIARHWLRAHHQAVVDG